MEISTKDLDNLREKLKKRIRIIYRVVFKTGDEEFYTELLRIDTGVDAEFADFVDELEG